MPTAPISLSPTQRNAACNAAAWALERHQPDSVRALVGFDGFVDVILRAVDTRRSMRTDDYQPITSIPAFADRIGAAAGKSANVELVTLESRFGGNGPLLAGCLASLGVGTTFIGCVGEVSPGVGSAEAARRIHPQFSGLADRCKHVIPLSQPAITHALEFSDGKIMFNMPGAIQGVTWESLLRAVGRDRLRAIVEESQLFAIVNWSIMAGVESILEGLCSDLLPGVAAPSQRRLFIDLSDPAKRTHEDLLRVLRLLSRINALMPVTLGLNHSEAQQACAALTLPVSTESSMPVRCLGIARAVRDALDLSVVVVHPREGAAASSQSETLWIDGPFTATPALSTGAGDHFGAAFALAQAINLTLDSCLALAVACSGAYVRDAHSPTATGLAAFLRAGW